MKNISKNRHFLEKIKFNIKSIITQTPPVFIKLFKNRIFISISTLAVGVLIGNRFDDFILSVYNWLISKNNYYNFIVLLLIIIAVLFLWIAIAYVRLNDKYLYNHTNINYSFSKIHFSSDDFYKELTTLITYSKYKDDLYISIGEGESLNDWIIRICEEAKSNRISKPQIRTINIRMLSQDLCKSLENNGYLSKGYCTLMKNNINKFTKNPLLKEYKINVNITYWSKLPSFHGFIYGKNCFVGSWTVNDNGLLHVRTPLNEFTAEDYPDKYEELLKAFKE